MNHGNAIISRSQFFQLHVLDNACHMMYNNERWIREYNALSMYTECNARLRTNFPGLFVGHAIILGIAAPGTRKRSQFLFKENSKIVMAKESAS